MTLYNSIIESNITDIIQSTLKDLKNEEVTSSAATTNEGTIHNITCSNLKLLQNNVPSTKYNTQKYSELFNISTVQLPKNLSPIAMTIKLLEDASVYGIIGFTSNNAPVNMLHFMTPTEQLESNIVKLCVYTYKEAPEYSDIVDRELLQISRIETALQYGYQHKERNGSKITIYRVNGNPPHTYRAVPNFDVSTGTSLILPEGEPKESSLVPMQFLTRGIIYPYYGVVGIQTSSEGRQGYDLTSMVSANISSSHSVCTGALPREKYDSYRSLNYCNLDSPYRTDVFPDNYVDVVHTHKQYMIIKLKGLLNENN